MKTNNLKYLVIILSLLFWKSTKTTSQEWAINAWQTELSIEINKEVNNQIEKGCLEGQKWWQNYFLKQLEFYPINEINTILENENANGSKLVICFFLFQEGYSDNIGHQTIIYTKRKHIEYLSSKLKDLSSKYEIIIRNLKNCRVEKYTSDCYGTGHSFATIFDKYWKMSKHIVNLNLELDK